VRGALAAACVVPARARRRRRRRRLLLGRRRRRLSTGRLSRPTPDHTVSSVCRRRRQRT